jgi:hypothetical protein
MNDIETSAAAHRVLENPLYYLDNFHHVLRWLKDRYGDVLSEVEHAFIDRFFELPAASQALLVRMLMRTGDLFRSSKLQYAEIGCTRTAAQPLLAFGWLDDAPLLTLDDLFGLLTKTELAAAFPLVQRHKNARKSDWLEILRPQHDNARSFADWSANAGDECVYAVRVGELCDRLRLTYFGNLYQDWSEFVISELGILAYEKVPFSSSSRGFQTRQDIDDYLSLYRCGERLEQNDPLTEIRSDLESVIPESDWLRSRREKLLFRLAQRHEQLGEWAAALGVYATCQHPGSRMRAVRVLEKMERIEDAYALAWRVQQQPEDEAEHQQLLRVLPRLQRRLKLLKTAVEARTPPSSPDRRFNLVLPYPGDASNVELIVRDYLTRPDAPVRYVENTLVNSLFGLLCWNAIFMPLPGAFFHPFQQGPADLHSADFVRRRQSEFSECLAQLESDRYRHTIVCRYREKYGIQSPFVFWDALDEELLELALHCIPPAHLRKWFDRMLVDIKTNRSGFPDLIQFWPREKSYRMIEVKGPGDRLQDNQIRFLDHCAANDMPAAVCYVRWQEQPA